MPRLGQSQPVGEGAPESVKTTTPDVVATASAGTTNRARRGAPHAVPAGPRSAAAFEQIHSRRAVTLRQCDLPDIPADKPLLGFHGQHRCELLGHVNSARRRDRLDPGGARDLRSIIIERARDILPAEYGPVMR